MYFGEGVVCWIGFSGLKGGVFELGVEFWRELSVVGFMVCVYLGK